MNSTLDLIGIILGATLIFIGIWYGWDAIVEGIKKGKKK